MRAGTRRPEERSGRGRRPGRFFPWAACPRPLTLTRSPRESLCLFLFGGGDGAPEHLLGLLPREPNKRRLAPLDGRLLRDLPLAREPVLGDRLGLDPHGDVSVAAHSRAC